MTRRLLPFALSLAAQTISAGIVVPLTISVYRAFAGLQATNSLPLSVIVTLHTASLLGLTTLMRLPMAWKIVNCIFPLALILRDEITVAPFLSVISGITFIVALCIYLPTLVSGVPYFQSDKEVLNHLKKIIPTSPAVSFLDLGAGFGDVVMPLSKHFPNHHFYAVELAPFPALLGKIRALWSSNVVFTMGSMWNHPIDNITHIYTFLSPEPMARLAEWLLKNASPGLTLISYQFPIEAWKESSKVELVNGKTLWIYDVPTQVGVALLESSASSL